MTQRPIGNPGGLLVAMVQRPEDFADLPGYQAPPAPVAAAKPLKQRNAARQVDQDIEVIEAREAARLGSMAGAELNDWVYRQLSVLGVMKRLSVHERGLLQQALEDGRLDGRILLRELTRTLAQAPAALDAAVEDLRTVIAN